MIRSFSPRVIPFLVGAAFSAGLVATCSRLGPDSTGPHGPAPFLIPLPAPAFARAAGQTSDANVADIAARAVPAVVNISATRVAEAFRHPFLDDPFFRDFFGEPDRIPPTPQQGIGSGVIVSADGIVLTNNHVVAQAKEIRVKLNDGREFDAEVKGTDPQTDLAVLRLKSGKDAIAGLPVLSFGNSDELRLGDVVLAIGNPFGVGQTVTMGIVSGLGRGNIGLADYEDFIQTDAAINPGNSGGALVNMRGELVGINTAILSRSGGYQGIGFAIPASMAKPVMESLRSNGKVARGWLGVAIQDLDRDLASGLGVGATRGVLIGDVTEDGPAAKAGLKRGDVIVALNGESMHSTVKLRNRIAALGPGGKASLEVLRGSEKKTFDVKLEALPAHVASGNTVTPEAGALAGARLGELTPSVRRQFGIADEVRSGVVITDVEPGSSAARSGLRQGDVVIELNRTRIRSMSEFHQAYEQSAGTLLLLVQRGETTVFLALKK